jgi:hypothetical protein
MGVGLHFLLHAKHGLGINGLPIGRIELGTVQSNQLGMTLRVFSAQPVTIQFKVGLDSIFNA